MAHDDSYTLIAFEDGTFSWTRLWRCRDQRVKPVLTPTFDGLPRDFNGPFLFLANCEHDGRANWQLRHRPDDVESDGPKVKGFIVREVGPVASNFGVVCFYPRLRRVSQASKGWIPAPLTKKLHVSGALGCISTEEIAEEEAIKRAEGGGLIGVDFVKEVTAKESYPGILK